MTTDAFCSYHYMNFDRTLESISNLPDSVPALKLLLRNCRILQSGRKIHDYIWQHERYRKNRSILHLLVKMYGQCGSPEDARLVFDTIELKNENSWNVMLVAYGQNGEAREAFKSLSEMLLLGERPNVYGVASVLSACCKVRDLEQGRRIDEMITGSELAMAVEVQNALMNMYGKCKSLKHAEDFFDAMPVKSVASWTTIIDLHSEHGEFAKALELFHLMEEPPATVIVAALNAIRTEEFLRKGREIHDSLIRRGLDSDRVVAASLISMYSRCGRINTAKPMLHKMVNNSEEPDPLPWNAMISGCMQREDGSATVLNLLGWMQQEGIKPTPVTLQHVLNACVQVPSAFRTCEIEDIINYQVLEDENEGPSFYTRPLIEAYLKCGRLREAERVFDTHKCWSSPDFITWTTMISAYAGRRYSGRVLKLLRSMELEGLDPDSLIFVSVLLACADAGLVEVGCYYFASMAERGVAYTPEHCSCIVELLARAGWMAEAESFIASQPILASRRHCFESLVKAYEQHGRTPRNLAVEHLLEKPSLIR